MSFDDAVSALEGAAEADAQAEANAPSLFRPAPDQQAAPAESAPQGSTDPSGAAPEPPAPVDTFDGGKFNPDELPEELRPAWQQLQAAYTQKTQTLAEQRRQFEAFGDPQSLQEAVELYQTIRDPQNWAQLHQELTQGMAARGITAPGLTPAAPQAAPEAPVTPDLNQVINQLRADPDLAPVAQIVEGLGQQVKDFQATLDQATEAARQEQMQMAMVGEIQRQHAIVSETYPHFKESDIDTVYELALAHDGNLLEAAKALDGYRSTLLSGYLEGKQQIADTPIAPSLGGQALSQTPQNPQSLEQATEIALETLKAAGLDTLDF